MGTRATPPLALAWLAGILWLAGTPASAAERVLAIDHLDGVRLGMTAAQAEKALGTKFEVLQGKRSEACWIGSRRDDPGINYMMESGRVTRIDILSPSKGGRPNVVTAAGIGVGASLAAVKRAYPKAAEKPHPIGDPGRWMLVEQSPRAGIRLQLENGKVTWMWAAQSASIDYYEGCL